MSINLLDQFQEQINLFMDLLLRFFPSNLILYFGKQYISSQNPSDLIFYFQDFHKLSNDIKDRNEIIFDNPDNFEMLNSYVNLPNLWFSLNNDQKEQMWTALNQCVNSIELYLDTTNQSI